MRTRVRNANDVNNDNSQSPNLQTVADKQKMTVETCETLNEERRVREFKTHKTLKAN